MKPTPKEKEKREPARHPIQPEMDRGLDQAPAGAVPEPEPPPREKPVEDL